MKPIFIFSFKKITYIPVAILWEGNHSLRPDTIKFLDSILISGQQESVTTEDPLFQVICCKDKINLTNWAYKPYTEI